MSNNTMIWLKTAIRTLPDKELAEIAKVVLKEMDERDKER